jgi:hypothetical protein
MTRTFALLIALSLDVHAAENFVSLTLTLRQDMLSASVGGVGVVDRPHLDLFSGAWHRDIGSTIFWVGEPARGNDPGNCRSTYLAHWLADFGKLKGVSQQILTKDIAEARHFARRFWNCSNSACGARTIGTPRPDVKPTITSKRKPWH